MSRWLWFALLVFAAASPADAANDAKHILVVQSSDQAQLTYGRLTDSLKAELSRRLPQSVQFVQFSLEQPVFREAPGESVVAYLRSLFAGSPDLIVTIGGPAALFVQTYREQLFPGAPALMAGVDVRFVQNRSLPADVAAVAVKHDPAQMIDNILRLLPDTTHLFVVLGASLLEQSWRDVVRRESSRYPQLTFDWASGSFSDVLKHAAMLPGHSAILYGLFNLDAEGAAYDEEHVLAELHAVATAPLFGFQSHQLGYGIVGGSLIPLDEVSHHTVDVAVRMVNGEPPGHIKTFVLAAAHPTFDWRELRRWHINESRLPSGSLVRLREPTIWQRSKWLWLTGGAIGLVEGLLIVGLVVNLRKRKQTERSLLENVTDQKAAQSALSSLSRRLMEAQDEERARVARNLHDDVGQQLGYLAFELGLLQREDRHRRKADRVLASALNLVRNASKSVHDLSYQLHPAKLGLMGLVPVISSLVRELSQPTLSIAFIHESVPVGLPDDIALCLFRVVQEALRNVMTHSAATQVSVQLRGATEGLTLSIADDGVGFDVDRIRTSGLGFPGMEERLRSVGGRCQIRSRPGAGTTLDVVVPLPATPRTIH